MKKLFISVITFMLLVSGSFLYAQKTEIPRVPRISELQLEGFINDYFYRRQIKDKEQFNDFDAYGSVLAESIIVYVYLKKDDVSQERVNKIKDVIKEGLYSTLLNIDDFSWVRGYHFSVEVRGVYAQ